MTNVVDFTERKAEVTYEEVASALENTLRGSCAEALEVMSLTDVIGILECIKFETQVGYMLTIE